MTMENAPGGGSGFMRPGRQESWRYWRALLPLSLLAAALALTSCGREQEGMARLPTAAELDDFERSINPRKASPARAQRLGRSKAPLDKFFKDRRPR